VAVVVRVWHVRHVTFATAVAEQARHDVVQQQPTARAVVVDDVTESG
jgi:hypothetical protein